MAARDPHRVQREARKFARFLDHLQMAQHSLKLSFPIARTAVPAWVPAC